MSFDPELFGQAMGEAIRKAVDPLKAEIADLRKELDEARAQSPDIAGMVDLAVSEAVKAIPAPKDGTSFTLEDAKPIIEKAVELICEDAEKAIAEAVSAIPVPKNGDNGTSVTVDDVRPLIEAEIEKAVKQIPVPKDGIGMAGSMIDRGGNLIITMTNGEANNLGPVVGKDGLSLESFEMAYDADAHEIVLKAVSVGKSQEIRYPAGGIHGKGYWRDGNRAKSGEAWTHDGSLWVAKNDTSETPSAKSGDWTLAARRGRDGESVVRRVKDGPATPIKLGGDDAGND